MNNTAKLLLTALIFTSWAKAGLQYDWLLWIVDLVVLVMVLFNTCIPPDRGRHFALLWTSHSRVCLYVFLSFLEPRYNTSP